MDGGDQSQVVGPAGNVPPESDTAEPDDAPLASTAVVGAVSGPVGQPSLAATLSISTAPPDAAEQQQNEGGDGFPPNGIVANRGHEAEPLPGDADPTGPGDAAIGEPTGTQGEGLESSQRVEEHFQPSLPMQEMVVNFLLRMAFVIGGDRDHDFQVHTPWL